MRSRLLILFLIGGISTAFGQNKKADSLRMVLVRYPQPDTFRVNRLNELADVLVSSHLPYDSVANEALQLAQKLAYPYGEIKALFALSTHHKYGEVVPTSQQYAENALQLAQQTGDKKLMLAAYMNWNDANITPVYQKQIADNLAHSRTLARQLGDYNSLLDIELGTSYWYDIQGNYPKALQYALTGLTISKKSTIPATSRIEALHRLAYQYGQLQEYNQALLFMRRTLALANASDDISFIKTIRKPIILANLGDLYLKMGRSVEAEQCLLQALQTKGAPIYSKQYLESLLAEAYEQQGKYALTFQTAFPLLSQFRQIHNEVSFYATYELLSQAYLHTNRPDSAVFYGTKAFQYAKRTHSKAFIRDQSDILAQAYAQLHDFGKAYKYLQTYVSYRDSLTYEAFKMKTTVASFNEQLRAQQSRVAFLNKTRQLEVQAARRQQILLYVLAGTLLMLTVLAYVLFRNSQQKQKANALLSRQKQQIEHTLTELHATQAQLIQKEKLASLGELTAGIAHEIQNPLNFVNNFSEVSTELIEELKDGPFQKLPDSEKDYAEEILGDLTSNLQKINHHGGRASSIVKGMLEHSRTESGEKRPTDLNALADEYLKIAYHGLRANNQDFNCELVTEFDSAMGLVEVVPQEIGRVLLNLYNNAFYAVSERSQNLQGRRDLTGLDDYQPTVRVSTKQAGNGVQICVSDNGTGVPDSVKAKIFQPFFTTKPTGEGTGLGLSLSYDIVTKGHRGSLTVESMEGQGTEFIILLPIA